MTINISLQDVGENLHPKITVLGVGGSGGNAVNNMMNSNQPTNVELKVKQQLSGNVNLHKGTSAQSQNSEDIEMSQAEQFEQNMADKN